jgi:hypothetical protein
MKTLLSLFGVIYLASCASVGAVIDGGKELTTGVVDATVGTAVNVSGAVLQDVSDITKTAAETVQGVAETVGAEVDRQTDELQDTPEGK